MSENSDLRTLIQDALDVIRYYSRLDLNDIMEDRGEKAREFLEDIGEE